MAKSIHCTRRLKMLGPTSSTNITISYQGLLPEPHRQCRNQSEARTCYTLTRHSLTCAVHNVNPISVVTTDIPTTIRYSIYINVDRYTYKFISVINRT